MNLKLVLLVLLVGHSAFGGPVVELSEKWNARAKWTWLTSSSQRVKLLFLQLNFETPSPVRAVEASGKSTIKSAQEVEILLTGIRTEFSLTFQDGSTKTVTAKLVANDSPLISSGCQELDIQLPEKMAAPFFLGVACEKRKRGWFLSLSAPKEWEWMDSNMVESKGKGERWKAYDWKNDAATSTGIRFLLSEGKSKELFRIEKKTPQTETPPVPPADDRFQMAFGLGVAASSLDIPSAKRSSVLPGLYAEFSAPLSIVRVGVLGIFGVPLPPRDSNIGTYDGEGYVGLPLALGDSMKIEPRLNYLVMGLGYNASDLSFSFRYRNPGVGMETQWLLSPQKNRIRLNVLASGFVGNSDQKVVGFDLGYDFATTSSTQFGLLLNVRQESYSASDGERVLRQVLFHFVLRR